MNDLAKKDIAIQGGLVQLQNMSDALQFCQQVFQSGLAPSSFKTPQAIFAALQLGAELSLKPMQAMQCLAVVNGRVSIMDKGARGIVAGSGLLESCEDRFEGSGDDLTAICVLRRKGISNTYQGRFSVADAKRAGLWGKVGPWTMYPKDMLSHKASARAHNAGFSDVLIGLPVFEDVQDLPPEKKSLVNESPVRDPLFDAVPTTPGGAQVSSDVVDAEFKEHEGKTREEYSEPRGDLEELQKPTGALLIEGDISFAKSSNPAYWSIKCQNQYFSFKHGSFPAMSAALEEAFKVKKHRKFRIDYTQSPWEKNGKSGVNNTVVNIEAI